MVAFNFRFVVQFQTESNVEIHRDSRIYHFRVCHHPFPYIFYDRILKISGEIFSLPFRIFWLADLGISSRVQFRPIHSVHGLAIFGPRSSGVFRPRDLSFPLQKSPPRSIRSAGLPKSQETRGEGRKTERRKAEKSWRLFQQLSWVASSHIIRSSGENQ